MKLFFLSCWAIVPGQHYQRMLCHFTVPFDNHHWLSQAICLVSSSITSCGANFSRLRGALWSSAAMAGRRIATHGLLGLGFLTYCRGWLYVSLVSEDIVKPYSQTEICTLEAGAEEEICYCSLGRELCLVCYLF